MPTYYCFWRGDLPAITELFFASFLATQRGEMHVFLDRCGDIGPLGLDYLRSPRVIVHAMDWRRFNPDPVFDGFIANLGASRLDARMFRLHRRLHPNAFERHPQHGVKFTSQQVRLPLWGPVKQPYPPFFYGDLFRCMLCAGEPGDLLYADLDVCFLKDFTPLFESGDFLYHWERQPYANSAILYSAAGGILKQAVKDLVRHHDTVAPWYLFTLAEPRLAGLRILPCEWFDPLWSNEAGLTFEDFFNGRAVGPALEGAYCHHWHNQWHVVPHEDSTSMTLLRTFRRMLGATR
ncbi:MAG: hypothetical protein ACKOZU_09985 [Planctomycetaceae bacterium]